MRVTSQCSSIFKRCIPFECIVNLEILFRFIQHCLEDLNFIVLPRSQWGWEHMSESIVALIRLNQLVTRFSNPLKHYDRFMGTAQVMQEWTCIANSCSNWNIFHPPDKGNAGSMRRQHATFPLHGPFTTGIKSIFLFQVSPSEIWCNFQYHLWLRFQTSWEPSSLKETR